MVGLKEKALNNFLTIAISSPTSKKSGDSSKLFNLQLSTLKVNAFAEQSKY